LERTAVGDRYVVQHMREHGFNLGGEQSGHIVLSDYSTTGDGLIAALQILAVLVHRERPASEVCRVFEPVPQILKSVRVNGGAPLADDAVRGAVADGERRLADSGRLLIRPSGTEPVIRVMADGERRLADSGRLLIRPSGTEPVIRVMAEGDDADLVAAVVDEIADVIQRADD